MAKILIVEDLATEARIMMDTATKLGHLCIQASDGEQGLDLARREKPNLILLDVVLPKLDGFNVCRKIKKDPETAGIPVIVVSSKNQESDKFWGLKQGASAYLTKPISVNELSDAISKHIA